MSVRSLRALAVRRRTVGGAFPSGAAAALPPGPAGEGEDGLTSLEEAVPTEIIAFYTAVIAACETVLARSEAASYLPFRAAVYAIGLVGTCLVAWRATQPAVEGWRKALATPEWWTAVLSFAAWGLAVPGSFLYVWLNPNALTITVASITAAAALIIGVVLTPRLKGKDSEAKRKENLALIPVPPGPPAANP